MSLFLKRVSSFVKDVTFDIKVDLGLAREEERHLTPFERSQAEFSRDLERWRESELRNEERILQYEWQDNRLPRLLREERSREYIRQHREAYIKEGLEEFKRWRQEKEDSLPF